LKTTTACEARSTTAIEFDILSFLMDTSNLTEQSTKEEDDARRKELKEGEAETRNSSTDSVNPWSGLDYQIYISLG
jgi:hypothetical protein